MSGALRLPRHPMGPNRAWNMRRASMRRSGSMQARRFAIGGMIVNLLADKRSASVAAR